MAIDSVVRVNGTTYAWNSSIFMIDGVAIEGIVAVDHEEKREVGQAYASRQDGTPVAFAGGGKYSVSGFKIRFLKDTWEVVKQLLAAGGSLNPGAGSYGDAYWTWQAQCVEPIVGMLPITMNAGPCRIVGKREAREEGVEALVVEADIACLLMVENGIPLFSIVRGLL